MKEYNPFSLDIKKDEPSFVNEEGTKWWLVSYGSSLDEDNKNKEDGAVYRLLTTEGRETYVVVFNGGIVHESDSLESCLFKIDENFLRRTK